jgi:hypothetical protein
VPAHPTFPQTPLLRVEDDLCGAIEVLRQPLQPAATTTYFAQRKLFMNKD